MAMELAAVAMGGGSFERMRQKIWKCLRDPKIKRFSVLGWEGVGGFMITKQVVDELSKLQQQEGNDDETESIRLFDHIIWLEESSFSPDTMMELIAKALGIDMPKRKHLDFSEFEISIASQNRKLLIIVYINVQQTPEMSDTAASRLEKLMPNSSIKCIVIEASVNVSSDRGIEVRIVEELGDLSDDEAWALLCHEAADIVNDPDLRIYLPNGGDSAMQCLCCCLLSLDPIHVNRLMSYCLSEGHFKSGQSESREQHFLVFFLLLHKFQAKGMIQTLENKCVTVSLSMRAKLIQILDPQGSYSCNFSSWEGINLRKFILRCGLKLEEAPKLDEWEQDQVETISLDNNNIKELGPSPKCPCLSTLLISHNPLLRQIPEDFFQHMQGLRVLELSKTGITSLPSSLSFLTNLRFLGIESCPGLDTLPLPLLHALQKLEVLLLKFSPLPSLKTLSLHMNPNLCHLEISHASNLTQLSLRGCHSLEVLFPPTNLEMLDLSSTKIRDFTHFKFSSLTRLTRLDLLDTKHLTLVPWHEIDRLPQTLNWDQCSHQSPTAEQLQTNRGYCITVCDDTVFETLSKDSDLWEEYLKKFRFSIVSCEHHPHQQHKDHPFEGAHFIYRRMYLAKTKHFTEFKRSHDRILEIGSVNNVPYGIRGVLFNTEFLSVSDNNSIIRLSQLGVENMNNLIECRIQKCQNMQSLLTTGKRRSTQAFIRLENLLVFDLTNLKFLCRGTFSEESFACLRWIYLEHCPRLFSLFSSSVRLNKLETLEIRFCGNLERLFEEDDVSGKDVFPQLKELCLWELGKLKSICSGDLPALEKLKIHGCRLLQKLPLLIGTDCKLKDVVIGGEKEWQKNLKWEDNRIFQRVKLKVPRAFKIVVIMCACIVFLCVFFVWCSAFTVDI